MYLKLPKKMNRHKKKKESKQNSSFGEDVHQNVNLQVFIFLII